MPPRILLVEPDKLLADIYCRALIRNGYEVAYAASGQEAVDSADLNTPDLILLELQLPAHNGLEFLYELRSYDEWRAIPVIINSVIPPDGLGSVAETVYGQLGVKVWHYKPKTELRFLLRSILMLLGEK